MHTMQRDSGWGGGGGTHYVLSVSMRYILLFGSFSECDKYASGTGLV